MNWTGLFLAILAAILIWWLIKRIKGSPGAFSGENLSKSFFTMGILALILIAFVAALVFFLRHSS